jgi:hypothetical protein
MPCSTGFYRSGVEQLLFQAMREQTERELTDIEIVSAIVGSVAGILIGWTTEYEDG